MPKFTREKMLELWRLQEERHAGERIREAVAKSGAPLPEKLAQAVIQLNDKYTRAILREHKGFALAERRNRTGRAWLIAFKCLQDRWAPSTASKTAAPRKSGCFDPAR